MLTVVVLSPFPGEGNKPSSGHPPHSLVKTNAMQNPQNWLMDIRVSKVSSESQQVSVPQITAVLRRQEKLEMTPTLEVNS